MKYYPDISHYNPVESWRRVQENCPFIISKATQGTSYVDSTLDEVIRKCEKRGIPYWLYAYLNRGEEMEQAKFLVNTCKGKVGGFFVGYALDVEAGNSPSGVQKAMEYLKTQNTKMMLYTMYAEYERYKELIAIRPKRCAWWEARYGLNDGRYNANYPSHEGADLQQYTSEGRCPGIEGNTDLNRVTGMGKKARWFTRPRAGR
ncbi:MAG: GH25 family lysozyme [Eubacteriales bacterium]|nr:GH25 family lysozyme [Eubacteriales bacterium]